MFAGSYFCILLTQFTLAVVQISAVGVKKTKKTICNVPDSVKKQHTSVSVKKSFIYVFSSIIFIKSGHKAKRIFTLTRTSSSLYTYSTVP